MKGIQAFVSSSKSRNPTCNLVTGTCSIYTTAFDSNAIGLQRSQKQLMMASEPNQFQTLPTFPNFSSTGMILGSDFEPAQTFEPQVNTPALFSFVIIAFVFSLLQWRINSVRDAAIRREEALTFLRQVKSEQLDSSFSNSNTEGSNQSEVDSDNEIMNKKVRNAIKAYESALKEELNLRTIIPGIRIVAPNDAARREEDIAAAKQFLDWDILLDEEDASTGTEKEQSSQYNEEIGQRLENDESRKTSLLMQSRRRFDGKDSQNDVSSSSSENENETMPNSAKAILLIVALSQIALLFLLSLDPMSANNMFTDIAGNPPDNIPLSSWSN